MARYDYKCTACGTVFEVEHAMTEHPEVGCPACGAAAEKVFSASGIVFEGHGFYNTDQRDTPRKASAKGEGTGSTAGEKADTPKKAESKGEPKPQAETKPAAS